MSLHTFIFSNEVISNQGRSSTHEKKMISKSKFEKIIITYWVRCTPELCCEGTCVSKLMEKRSFPFIHPSIHSSIYSSTPPGILNLPAVALGIITGGFILKRFKLGVIGAARVAITASIGSLCLLAVQTFLHCDNAEVGGLTVSYQGWVTSRPLRPASIFWEMHMLNRSISKGNSFISRWYNISVHVRVHQGSSSVLQPTDFAVTVQHGLLLLTEALGPSMRLQWNDLCLTVPGWLPILHRHWQRNGKAAAFIVS